MDREAALDGVEHDRWIQTSLGRERQRFTHGGDIARHDDLVCELRHVARADVSQCFERRLNRGGERVVGDWRCRLDVAAAIDRERERSRCRRQG